MKNEMQLMIIVVWTGIKLWNSLHIWIHINSTLTHVVSFIDVVSVVDIWSKRTQNNGSVIYIGLLLFVFPIKKNVHYIFVDVMMCLDINAYHNPIAFHVLNGYFQLEGILTTN